MKQHIIAQYPVNPWEVRDVSSPGCDRGPEGVCIFFLDSSKEGLVVGESQPTRGVKLDRCREVVHWVRGPR